MKRIANQITKFVIKCGAVDEKHFELYEYGFLIGIEAGICIVVTLTEAILLGKVIEWFFFFLTFIPLRSYAGGLHLKSFLSCFILSNMIFLLVLVISGKLFMEPAVMLFYILLLLMCIYSLYPIENSNRTVSPEESLIIRRKFNKVILGRCLISVIMFALSYRKGLSVQMMTLLMIAVTMVLEKMRLKHQD